MDAESDLAVWLQRRQLEASDARHLAAHPIKKPRRTIVKIFGRDPAVLLALVGSLVKVAALFFFPLTIDQQGTVNAVAVALVAIATSLAVKGDDHLPVIVGGAQALLALLLSFGLHWTPEQQTGAMLVVSTLAAFLLVRPNVVAPVPSDSPVAADPVKVVPPGA